MSSELALAAGFEAVVACQRLAAQLAQLSLWLEHAASVARADWTGPHRETFDDRVADIARALHDAAMAVAVLPDRVAPDQ